MNNRIEDEVEYKPSLIGAILGSLIIIIAVGMFTYLLLHI